MADADDTGESKSLQVDVDFTSRGHRAYERAVDAYAQSLAAFARAASGDREVTAAHVDSARRVLGPAPEIDAWKVLLDWIKRLGFLVVGLAITQAQALAKEVATNKVLPETVIWLAVAVVISVTLICAALATDIPKISLWLASRRIRKG